MSTTSARPPPGLDWETYVAWLVSEHGGVAPLAERLVEARRGAESIESVERALRRLRARGVLDGGTWGQRLLHRFGLPPDVEGRLRWMGSYHTRFSDLPRGVCLDHLASWDRAPIAASRGRVWLLLGRAGVALRGRDFDLAESLVSEAGAGAPRGQALAELALAEVYLATKQRRTPTLTIDEAEAALTGADVHPDDHACMVARIADHRAFHLNIARRPDPHAALALYEALPEVGPAFAVFRRASGVAWSSFKLGDHTRALASARLAEEAAGDGGFMRLRAMALNLLVRLLPGEEGARHAARARAIAAHLDDEELRVRVERAERDR